jgi:hypothetical protein
MGWFWRRKKADAELLQGFLNLEQARVARAADLEARRAELELKRIELELDHLDARTKADIETAQAKQELRQKRTEWSRKARERVAQQRAQMQPTLFGYQANGNCPVCLNPSSPTLTPEVIMWHHAGHPSSLVQ